MDDSAFQKTIANLTDTTLTILNGKNEYGIMKKAIESMHSIFSSINGNTIQNQNTLLSGKAISPAITTDYLIEIKRTVIFLRDIYRAIMQLSSGRTNHINVLYAGTGPYASLITPLLLLLPEKSVKVDLLDINHSSLISALDLIHNLKLNHFIGDAIIDDAAKHQLGKDYDIVISETMKTSIKKELQFAIKQNIMPQLKQDAIFIPEKLIVDTNLVSKMY